MIFFAVLEDYELERVTDLETQLPHLLSDFHLLLESLASGRSSRERYEMMYVGSLFLFIVMITSRILKKIKILN